MTDHVRLGVIGAGAISSSCCAAVAKHDQATVVAAFDLDPGRLSDLCQTHGIETQYDNAEALLANTDIDAVYVAVPNKFHAPYARSVLDAGKHCILDKPFALNLEQASEVAASAKSSGKLFMMGMNQRYARSSQQIRALKKAGRFGEVYHAKAYWMRRSGIPKFGTWFGNKALAGGGAVLDIGVHMLDLALHVTDLWEPVSVTGATYTKFGNRGLGEGGWGKSDATDIEFDVDDFATALIKFEGGATVSLDVSWACHQPEVNRNNVQVFGTEGGALAYPGEVYRYGEDGYAVESNLTTEPALPHCDRFHNFINCILGTEQPLTTIDEALALQRILDAIYESCRTGSEVRFT